MADLGFSYATLTQSLRDRFELEGDEWNEKNVANKVARGTFSAVFFVQCLEAMGVTDLRLNMASRVVGREKPDQIGLATDARARARVREMRNQSTSGPSPKTVAARQRRVAKELKDLE
jgi:hypothetical protein